MIGFTLGRYFLFRYLTITMWFFIGISALAFIIDFTEFSNRTSALPKYTAGLALWVTAMRLPVIMQQTVPFIALFSAMATLISLNRRYELVVTRSAGVSAWQFLAPICLGAFLFGTATILIINPLGAAGYSRAEAIETGWRLGHAAQARAGLAAPWLSQVTEDGLTIIGSRAVLKQGAVLAEPVFIKLDKDGDIERRYDAKRAVLREGYWVLVGVRETRKGQEPKDLKQIRVKTNLKKEFVAERLAPPETVAFFDLLKNIRIAESFGFAANSFRMHFQSLVALPALLVAMTLIAATVSLKFVRFGQSAGMILGGIGAGFLLYVVSVLVKAFGSTGFVAPVLAAWFPVVVAAFFGVSFLLHKEDG